MTHHRCITIGASAGGYEIVLDIISKLPADLPAPVFLVIHIPPHERSYLPEVLTNTGQLSAIHPTDGMAIEAGMIYVAPPDHHLLIDDGRVAVKRGPKENGFRPSIDALFRSAAYSYGPGVVGVVLSGALNDGTSGLWTIKRLGGVAIIQDPYEAQFPSMPRSALEYVDADYKAGSKEISELLIRLASERVDHEIETPVDPELEDRIAKEIQIAAGQDISHKTVLALGELSPFTCVECQGVLISIVEDKLIRYRCHTGHGFTEDALLEHLMVSTSDLIWQSVRSLQEIEMLLDHMGHHIQDAGDSAKAQNFLNRAREVGKVANRFHDLAIEHANFGGTKLDKDAGKNEE